jgi:uncharacterized membrane protein YqiK
MLEYLSYFFLGIGSLLLLGVLLTINAMKKIEPSQVLVKNSFWSKQYQVCTGSAFAFRPFHSVRFIDLKTKKIVIERVKEQSLRCKDGVRVEVKIVFQVGVNKKTKDILWVSEDLGCQETFDIESVENYLRGGLLNALNSVIQSIDIDKISQDFNQIKDQILVLLSKGSSGEIGETGEVIYNGYRINEVSIEQLRQLPLEAHAREDIEDLKGIKKVKLIAETQKHELDLEKSRIEEEGKEKKQELFRQEQNREEERKQIKHKLTEEDYKREQASKDWNHQESLKEKARTQELEEVDNRIRINSKEREENIKNKEHQVNLDDQNREGELAEAKQKTMGLSIRVAQQEQSRNEAVVIAKNATAIQEALGQKDIEIIRSEIEAQQQLSSIRAEVEGQTYKIKEVAKAKREAAEENGTAAESEAEALTKIGLAEAGVLKAKVEAENAINQQRINAKIIQEFIPVLPQIVERLMSPVDKIDSIKFVNINGMEGFTPAKPVSGHDISQSDHNTPFNSLLNVIMNVGIFLPVMKEVVATLKQDNHHQDILELVKEVPGGKAFLDFIERSEGLSQNNSKPEVIQDDYPE